jgi:hypothetical protein
MSDTIISSDLPRFHAFLLKPRGDDVYEGYGLNIDGMVEMSVYDADTHEIIDRRALGQNGLAQKSKNRTCFRRKRIADGGLLSRRMTIRETRTGIARRRRCSRMRNDVRIWL